MRLLISVDELSGRVDPAALLDMRCQLGGSSTWQDCLVGPAPDRAGHTDRTARRDRSHRAVVVLLGRCVYVSR